MLTEQNSAAFHDLVRKLRAARGPQGSRHLPLWRLHPERWLESLVVRDVRGIDERLDHNRLYSQVPAFSASDRAMLDVLVSRSDTRRHDILLEHDSGPVRSGARQFRMSMQEGLDSSFAQHRDTGEIDLTRRVP